LALTGVVVAGLKCPFVGRWASASAQADQAIPRIRAGSRGRRLDSIYVARRWSFWWSRRRVSGCTRMTRYDSVARGLALDAAW